MFYRPGKKTPKTLEGAGGNYPPPLALIRPRVKLEFPAVNFSCENSRLYWVSSSENISPGVSYRKWKNVNSGEEREKTAVLAG